MRCSKTTTIISVEELGKQTEYTRHRKNSILKSHLIEPNVITEVGIGIQLGVSAVGGTFSFMVAAENMDDAVLNLFSDIGQVHEIAATSGALDLIQTLGCAIRGSRVDIT